MNINDKETLPLNNKNLCVHKANNDVQKVTTVSNLIRGNCKQDSKVFKLNDDFYRGVHLAYASYIPGQRQGLVPVCVT